MEGASNRTFYRAGVFFGLGLLTVYLLVLIVVAVIYTMAAN